jgi:hypothetical protein
MPETPGEDWRERLREAAEEELGALLAEHRDELDVLSLRRIFANPFLSRRLIEEMLAVAPLVVAYEFRRAAAFHPLTPRAEALRFVGRLYWADLVRLGADTRVHPVVRRGADLRLVERLPGLAVGEKVAIARGGSPAVLAALRNDPTPRVVAALLENPRLTEATLLPLLASERASPQTLALVAGNPKWSSRYPLRLALCRNPRTPLASALPHLPQLLKRDLEGVASDTRLLLPLRRRAQLLAGEAEGGPRRI